MGESEKLSSEIGFNAADAINEINKLAKAFQTYTQSLRATADGTQRTVAEQSKLDRAIAQNTKSVQQQVKAYQALARAQAALAKTQPKIDTQAQGKVAAAARAAVESSLFSGFRKQASLGEIVNFDKSLDALDKLVTRTDISEDQITKILSNLKGQYTGAERVIRDSIAKIVAANNKLGAQAVKSQAKILKNLQPSAAFTNITPLAAQREADLRNLFRGQVSPNDSQANQAVSNSQKIAQGIQQITISWSTLARVAVAQAIIGQMRQIIGAFQEGARAAIDFEISLARIQTLDEDFKSAGLDSVSSVVTGLAAEFGRPIGDVSAGLYDALSNQIGNATESTEFLRAALELSVATVSTTTQSVDVLTGVINSYGLTAASASAISDKLFKTVDLGNVKLEDMANSLGRLNPLAASLGVSFDEVLASVAELTIQGVDFADASTQITNVMLKLIRPTEALKKRFDELGVASGEAGVAAFGFQGFLTEIAKESGTAASEIGEFFNQIRGTRGVIGLIATDAARYQKTLKEIRDASEGATREAAGVILNTPAAQIQRQLTELQAFLVNDFGRNFNAVFLQAVNAIGGIVPAFIAASSAALTFAGAIGSLVILNQVASALRFFNIELATFVNLGKVAGALKLAGLFAIPAAAVAVLGTIVGNLTQAGQSADEFRQKIDGVSDSFRNKLSKSLKELEPQIAAQVKQIDEVVGAIERNLQARTALANRDRDTAINLQEQITQNLQQQLSQRESAVTSFVNRLVSVQSDAIDKIKAIQNESTGLRNATGQRQFERSIRSLSEQEQGIALVQRSQQFLQAAAQATGKGNIDIAKELFNEADALANRAADLGQGEAQVNSVLTARLGLNDRLIQQQQQQAQEAARLENQQRGVANAISTEIQNIGTLQQKLGDGLKDGSIDQATEKNLRDALTNSAGRLQGLFAQVTVGNLGSVTEFAKLMQQIQAPIRDTFSNEPVELSFAVQSGIDRVFETLQQQARATPLEVQIALTDFTGKPFDLNTGLQQQQTEIAKRGQDAKRLVDNQREFATQSSRAEEALEKVRIAQTGIVDNSNALASQTGKGFFNEPLGGIGADAATLAQGQQLGVAIGAEIQAGIKASIEGDAAGLEQSLAALRTRLATVQQARNEQSTGSSLQGLLGFGTDPILGGLEAQLQTAIQQLQTGAEAQLKALASGGAAEAVAALQGLNQTLIDAGPAANQGTGQAIIQQNNLGRATDDTTRKLQFQNQVMQQSGGGGAQTFARGGKVLHFANGGFVPHSDTVPAMLTPGEMVLNPRASRRFALDATALNLGLSNRSGDNTLNQNVTIKIDGSGDPNAVADAVIRRIERGKRAHIYR